MKLLTLNAHSLVETDYPQKLAAFAECIAKERPDVIALQEVSQTACKTAVPEALLTGYTPCGEDVTIREDNHVYNAVRLLADRGVHYHWTWLPLKLGYDRYDEGIAVMSLAPIAETDTVLVSAVNDYHNWKTRKLLGIRTKQGSDWFYSVHLGWWNDPEEPFQGQWERTDSHMLRHENVWLMGDFNSPAEVHGEGYDLIVRSGWYDSYLLAERKDSGLTVGSVIDGWRDKLRSTTGMRIDQIWCSRPEAVKSSRVLFNGIKEPVVSDHYGVMIQFERSSV
ncbi:MAG: endonuclease/exonuclease/phosphatase family protein [Oscillospiraceae bacterium]|nr:endonuclease/exonuclease/phosphatase family protein [Oscillospiraceae bacterium]